MYNNHEETMFSYNGLSFFIISMTLCASDWLQELRFLPNTNLTTVSTSAPMSCTSFLIYSVCFPGIGVVLLCLLWDLMLLCCLESMMIYWDVVEQEDVYNLLKHSTSFFIEAYSASSMIIRRNPDLSVRSSVITYRNAHVIFLKLGNINCHRVIFLTRRLS